MERKLTIFLSLTKIKNHNISLSILYEFKKFLS